MRNADPATLRACARWCRAEARKRLLGNTWESAEADAFTEAARHFEREARGTPTKRAKKAAKHKGAR